MEFHICAASGTRRASKNCGPVIIANGTGRIPPYFCAATETSHNIAVQYCETKLGTLKKHKFDALVAGHATIAELPETYKMQQHMQYLIEVYMDNFMALVIPTSKEEVTHVR